MAKIDDLLQRRAKQIVLAVVARLAHGSSLTANLAVKGTMNPASRESKTQEIRHPHPAFLQNRLLAQVKSQRSINRFPNSSRATIYFRWPNDLFQRIWQQVRWMYQRNEIMKAKSICHSRAFGKL
jgi:hypothetical protein